MKKIKIYGQFFFRHPIYDNFASDCFGNIHNIKEDIDYEIRG